MCHGLEQISINNFTGNAYWTRLGHIYAYIKTTGVVKGGTWWKARGLWTGGCTGRDAWESLCRDVWHNTAYSFEQFININYSGSLFRRSKYTRLVSCYIYIYNEKKTLTSIINYYSCVASKRVITLSEYCITHTLLHSCDNRYSVIYIYILITTRKLAQKFKIDPESMPADCSTSKLSGGYTLITSVCF